MLRKPLCWTFNRFVKRDQTMDFRANWVNGRFEKRVCITITKTYLSAVL
jgi:hypothetical protein